MKGIYEDMDIEFDLKENLEIRLYGELDHNALNQNKERIEMKIATTPSEKIILNLEGLTFMDSSGISFVYNAYKTASDFSKKVTVVSSNDKFIKILTLAKIDDFVDIVCNVTKGGVL